MASAIAAHKAALVDQARRWSEVTEGAGPPTAAGGWSPEVRARRVLATELACALRIPERAAETLIEESRMLLASLPATFTALSEGAIGWRHTRVLIDHATSLDPQHLPVFEAAVLPAASTLTVAKFDRRARTAREKLEPATIDTSHTTAVETRSVELTPGRDGMAWLTAHLPAVVAHGIYNRLTDTALAQQSPTEPRTLTQLRADACAELLLDGELSEALPDGPHPGEDTGTTPTGDTATGQPARKRVTGIRPRVLVTVPVMTLLGHSDEPAILEGYGPIDTATALELAGSAPSFTRLLTHPETGAVLSVGRGSYTVPADLRTWLRVRDGTCRFPGCSRAARNCEIDHTKDWQFGHGTNHDNLAHLCPAHHHLKHQTGWTVKQIGGGVLEWTSPSGHTYTTEPETRLEPTSQ